MTPAAFNSASQFLNTRRSNASPGKIVSISFGTSATIFPLPFAISTQSTTAIYRGPINKLASAVKRKTSMFRSDGFRLREGIRCSFQFVERRPELSKRHGQARVPRH
jgi:hypothetical protein